MEGKWEGRGRGDGMENRRGGEGRVGKELGEVGGSWRVG